VSNSRLYHYVADKDDLVHAVIDRWQEPVRSGLEKMRSRGKLRPDADPTRLATATGARRAL
jgi:AcrR family transcriptional regulator